MSSDVTPLRNIHPSSIESIELHVANNTEPFFFSLAVVLLLHVFLKKFLLCLHHLVERKICFTAGTALYWLLEVRMNVLPYGNENQVRAKTSNMKGDLETKGSPMCLPWKNTGISFSDNTFLLVSVFIGLLIRCT